jgi:hypothetical protein
MLSVLAYALIGLGVGASGTSLLALLATATAPRRAGGGHDHLADDDLRHRVTAGTRAPSWTPTATRACW